MENYICIYLYVYELWNTNPIHSFYWCKFKIGGRINTQLPQCVVGAGIDCFCFVACIDAIGGGINRLLLSCDADTKN